MADANSRQASRVFVHRRLEAFPLFKQFQAMRTHLHIGFSLYGDGPARVGRGMDYTNNSGIYQHKLRPPIRRPEKERTARKAVSDSSISCRDEKCIDYLFRLDQ